MSNLCFFAYKSFYEKYFFYGTLLSSSKNVSKRGIVVVCECYFFNPRLVVDVTVKPTLRKEGGETSFQNPGTVRGRRERGRENRDDETGGPN